MKLNNRFMCFSPPVMMATFVIEVSLLLYTLFRYKLTTVTRLAALLLFFLATFQLAEFMSCGSTDYQTWSVIGFVAITALPPLCIHMILAIAGKNRPVIKIGSYILAVMFAGVFLLPNAFVNHQCAGNYVIFKLTNGLSDAYFVYYYGLLFIGLALAMYYAVHASLHVRKALSYQVVGYLSFLLPTATVNIAQPETTAAIPSIMCGFAVIYAIIIVFGILPHYKQTPAFPTNKAK